MLTPVQTIASAVGRPVCRRGPRRPEEKGRQPAQVVRVSERARRDGVLVPSPREHIAVVRQVGIERRGSHWVDRQGSGAGVVRIRPHQLLQPALKFCLTLRRQTGIPVWTTAPAIEDEHRLTMEPIRRPVRRHVASMAPNGSHLHAPYRLPDILATIDFICANDLSAICRDDARRHWWRLLIDAEAGPPEHSEREHDHRAE